MNQPPTYFHGSDLEKIEQTYGIKKEEIINFAANVNPLGISYRLKKELISHIDCVTTYPDRAYTTLRTAISDYTGAPVSHITVGNGSTELISLVIQVLQPKHALVLGPTYSEYAHEISLAGGTLRTFSLKEEENFTFHKEDFLTEISGKISSETSAGLTNKRSSGPFSKTTATPDLFVICNPNNPTSSLIDRNTMHFILKECAKRNIFVMVDETYMEFTEEPSETTAIPFTSEYQNLIVLRGISKFFAAPGLRLGYGICGNEKLLKEMADYQNPWSVGSLTEIAGKIMFEDTEYIADTRKLILAERKRVLGKLSEMPGLKLYPAHANFILVRILDKTLTSTMLFEAAIKEKLMIRDCSSFKALGEKYFRFCLMSAEANDKLLAVITENLRPEARK